MKNGTSELPQTKQTVAGAARELVSSAGYFARVLVARATLRAANVIITEANEWSRALSWAVAMGGDVSEVTGAPEPHGPMTEEQAATWRQEIGAATKEQLYAVGQIVEQLSRCGAHTAAGGAPSGVEGVVEALYVEVSQTLHKLAGQIGELSDTVDVGRESAPRQSDPSELH